MPNPAQCTYHRSWAAAHVRHVLGGKLSVVLSLSAKVLGCSALVSCGGKALEPGTEAPALAGRCLEGRGACESAPCQTKPAELLGGGEGTAKARCVAGGGLRMLAEGGMAAEFRTAAGLRCECDDSRAGCSGVCESGRIHASITAAKRLLGDFPAEEAPLGDASACSGGSVRRGCRCSDTSAFRLPRDPGVLTSRRMMPGKRLGDPPLGAALRGDGLRLSSTLAEELGLCRSDSSLPPWSTTLASMASCCPLTCCRTLLDASARPGGSESVASANSAASRVSTSPRSSASQLSTSPRSSASMRASARWSSRSASSARRLSITRRTARRKALLQERRTELIREML